MLELFGNSQGLMRSQDMSTLLVKMMIVLLCHHGFLKLRFLIIQLWRLVLHIVVLEGPLNLSCLVFLCWPSPILEISTQIQIFWQIAVVVWCFKTIALKLKLIFQMLTSFLLGIKLLISQLMMSVINSKKFLTTKVSKSMSRN